MAYRSNLRMVLAAGTLVTFLASLTSCSPADLVGEGQLPPGSEDPSTVKNHDGALRAYRAAVSAARSASLGQDQPMAVTSGLIADELTQASTFIDYILLPDLRVLPEYTDPAVEDIHYGSYASYEATYIQLQGSRSKSQVAVWLLDNYAPTEPKALSGQVMAYEGFDDIFLADLYCSGVPLSTVEPEGYTLKPGSSTQQIYERAIQLFDSAMARSQDSSRIYNMAALGKGRALLDLGRYDEAAQAVAGVPDGYQYLEVFDGTLTGQNGEQSKNGANWTWLLYRDGSSGGPGVGDAEGANGLVWSTDPRTYLQFSGYDYSSNPLFLPAALDLQGGTPIALTDWREARLIEAEAALHNNQIGTYLNKMNALRASATFPADTAGNIPTLDPLTDPGTLDGRVDLLMSERAHWFFMTGRRLGDLRRLIRNYGRDPSSIFPIGIHASGRSYGSDVNAPVPAAERRYNHLFTGCQGRGA
jgi:tetratricopeptide (TPR) repeat protein